MEKFPAGKFPQKPIVPAIYSGQKSFFFFSSIMIALLTLMFGPSSGGLSTTFYGPVGFFLFLATLMKDPLNLTPPPPVRFSIFNPCDLVPCLFFCRRILLTHPPIELSPPSAILFPACRQPFSCYFETSPPPSSGCGRSFSLARLIVFPCDGPYFFPAGFTACLWQENFNSRFLGGKVVSRSLIAPLLPQWRNGAPSCPVLGLLLCKK